MPLGRNDTQEGSRQGMRGRRVTGRWGRLLVVVMLVCVFAVPALVEAREFHCDAGDVACLIRAVHVANWLALFGRASTIVLAEGTYTLTRVHNTEDGPNGLPSVTGPLTIQGAGAQRTVLERAASAPPFRLLHVAPSGILTLEGLTLRGGSIDNSDGLVGGGGGIFNNGGLVTLSHNHLTSNRVGGGYPSGGGGLFNNGGTIVLSASTLSGNFIEAFSAEGGAFATNGGSVTITNCTIGGNHFFGNSARGGGVAEIRPGGGSVAIVNSTIASNLAEGHTAEGGGIATLQGLWTITNSTIVGNFIGGFSTSSVSGGGIAARSPVTLQNTIVALNTSKTGVNAPDCWGAVTSLDHNLIGDLTGCTISLQLHDRTGNPGLGEYTDDGTPGQGHFPPLPTSQVIDAGNDAVCPPTDQLGQSRVDGNGDAIVHCDLGAVEFQP